MDSPELHSTTIKTLAGTLSADTAATIDIAALFDDRRVVGFEIKNTHGSGDLAWTGEGETATLADAPVPAGESSGWVPSNDKTLSLIREAGVAVTYVIVVSGR